MLNVGILGANGFIGTRTVETFHLGGEVGVIPIVRAYRSLARLSRFDVTWRIADATDERALRGAFEGCDVVVNCALTGPDSPEPIYRAAEAAGVRRIVHLSTASVHGQDPEPGTDESSPLHEHHSFWYNNAKVAVERKFGVLREKGSVELVSLRPGIVFGPRSQWVSSFARALEREEAYFVSTSQGICNSIYVDNLIHAIRACLTADGVDREAFLLGDAEHVTWEEFCRPIAAGLGRQIEDVPCIAPAAEPRASVRERLEKIHQSPITKAFLRPIPGRAKRLARGAVSGLVQAWRPPESSSFAPATRPPLEATWEATMLHRCSIKLPHQKAERAFGYQPIVSFPEGMRRSVEWLRFAGYAIK